MMVRFGYSCSHWSRWGRSGAPAPSRSRTAPTRRRNPSPTARTALSRSSSPEDARQATATTCGAIPPATRRGRADQRRVPEATRPARAPPRDQQLGGQQDDVPRRRRGTGAGGGRAARARHVHGGTGALGRRQAQGHAGGIQLPEAVRGGGRHRAERARPSRAGGDAARAGARAFRPVVEYLYVEANEGGSSGGHVALRLGEQVFHFQHQPPGIVAISRAPYGRFRHQYADLENRSIHVTRIPASEEAHARLADRFTRRHVVQDQQVAALHALARDRIALETMLEGRISVEGAGLFFADGAAGHWRPGGEGGRGGGTRRPGPGDPWILALRRTIDTVRGPRFVAERLEQARARIAALDPEELDLPAETLSEGRVPAPTYGFVQRYADVAAGLVALEVLRSARAARARRFDRLGPGRRARPRVGEGRRVARSPSRSRTAWSR